MHAGTDEEVPASLRVVGGGRSARARTPILRRVSDVEAEEVAFLWKPYMPEAKLVMLDGYEGGGKTFAALELASALSRGRQLPDSTGRPSGAIREPRSTLYVAAEDGIGDTLRPRLELSGADLDQIIVLDGFVEKNGAIGYFTLSDIDVLEAAIAQVNPALMVLDPVFAFLDVDGHKAKEIRPVLTRLAALAEKYRVTVLMIRHLRKAAADRASHRGVGSVDFSAACRSVLVLAEDPEDDRRRVIAHAKSNLAPRGPSLAFTIEDGVLTWAGLASMSADELLESREQRERRGGHRPRDEAAEFLRSLLGDMPKTQGTVEREANAAGISFRTVRRAKGELGVRSRRVRAEGGAFEWVWSLPGVRDDA